MTTIHHYHPASGEYTGSTQAQMSPLEPDVPLIPAHATTQAPPQAGAHQAAVFDAAASKWQLVPDWRGVQLYSTADGSEVAAELWQTPADCAATDKPRPSEAHIWKAGKWALDAAKQAALIKQAQDAAWTLIKAERDRRSEAGCLVAGQWFHNNLKSRTQWEHMTNRATTLVDADPYLVDGEQVAWKTMTGAFVPLTAGLIRQVVDAFEVQEVATFKAAETHRVAMEASADPAAYDYSGGWQKIYGE